YNYVFLNIYNSLLFVWFIFYKTLNNHLLVIFFNIFLFNFLFFYVIIYLVLFQFYILL
ncbi:hypothetical protein IMG5_140650, partial [Ichthyophthirius multifiliis]